MGTEPPRGNALARRAGRTLSSFSRTRRGSILLKAGLWIAGLIVLFVVHALIPAFAGLIIVLPVVAHATWHAYRDIVRFEDRPEATKNLPA